MIYISPNLAYIYELFLTTRFSIDYNLIAENIYAMVRLWDTYLQCNSHFKCS